MTVDSECVLATALDARSSHRKSFDGNERDVVRLPEAALEKLVRRLATTVGEGRIRQIVPFSPRRRVMDEFSHLVVGEAAGAGATVQRVYLVPAGDLRSHELDTRISRDREQAVVVRKVVVGAASPVPGDEDAPNGDGRVESPVHVPMRDVWLVDDQVVIKQEFGTEGPPVWVVSARQQDIEETSELWDRLWAGGDSSRQPHAMLRLSDPLLESADLIHSASQLSCTGDHVDELSCSWYHGVWQYLRLFNMVSSPRWHPEFYFGALQKQLGEAGGRRVLITGTADYGTLAFVLAAAEQHRDDLDIHVIDKCPTPLFACRWYAKRMGVEIKLHPMDLLEGKTEDCPFDKPFDVIVTDAFLTRFAPEKSAKVLRRWAGMLRPGGTVITTVRLHPRNGELQGVAYDVSDFLLRLKDRAENWRWMLQIDLKELLDAGREYALKMTSRDLGDLDEVLTLFDANGFDVGYSKTKRVEGELCETEYVRIVATVRQ